MVSQEDLCVFWHCCFPLGSLQIYLFIFHVVGRCNGCQFIFSAGDLELVVVVVVVAGGGGKGMSDVVEEKN